MLSAVGALIYHFIPHVVCAYLRLGVAMKSKRSRSGESQQERWILNAYLNCNLLANPLGRPSEIYAETSNYASSREKLYQFSNAARDACRSTRGMTSPDVIQIGAEIYSPLRCSPLQPPFRCWYVRNSRRDIASMLRFYFFQIECTIKMTNLRGKKWETSELERKSCRCRWSSRSAQNGLAAINISKPSRALINNKSLARLIVDERTRKHNHTFWQNSYCRARSTAVMFTIQQVSAVVAFHISLQHRSLCWCTYFAWKINLSSCHLIVFYLYFLLPSPCINWMEA